MRNEQHNRIPHQGRMGFVWILLIAWATSYSQPVLEHTYPISTSLCKLEEAGDKYFAMDVTGKTCNIYNLDHTLYRSVALTVPAEYYLYNIQHVSQHLFNTDDLIELVYIYSKYNATETSYYYSYETVLMNENGTVMETIPGAGHTEILETSDGERKFLVYVYDFYQVPAITQTKVYSLPDPPVEPLKSLVLPDPNSTGNPWPNPSGGLVRIPVRLPEASGDGELVLYNLRGQEVMRHEVKGNEEVIVLPGGLLIPGTYVYEVQQGSRKSNGKKIIIR